MNALRKESFLLVWLGCGCLSAVHAESSPLRLWYDSPATRWTEALVIGNGRLGGMVWGGPEQERIDLNEDTLWSGEPYDNFNPEGLKALPEIRRLLLAGNDKEAQHLIETKMNGKNTQCYMPLGFLTLDFPGKGKASDYRRELDLDQALVRAQFKMDGVSYTRECFASHPANAIVLRLTADKPGSISFTAKLDSLIRHETTAHGTLLRMCGRAPIHTDPHYVKEKRVIYDDSPDGKGMRFEADLHISREGGRVEVNGNTLDVKQCDSVTLVFVAATSYNGPHKSPSKEGKDQAGLCAADLARLVPQSYPKLRGEHITDYQALFRRVSLDLGHSGAEQQPTNLRIRNYQDGNDTALAALYYQFGRYLLISASRPGTQPSNLQGIWNHVMNPPWAANWTLNCNAQINYWAVESGNLAECHLPLIELTEQLSIDGTHIAKDLYGARGWVAHHNTDIWRQAGPVAGSARWSIFQVGSAWLCQHLWEHYIFSGDTDYLRRVWPVLGGAARFYLDTLTEEPNHHWLVTCPDTNWENTWKKPDGKTGAMCTGPTGSMEMIRELFQNCLKGGAVLHVDPELRAEIEKALPRLPPLQISPTTGRLQEWIDDWIPLSDCQVLSSWGAVCGTQIGPRKTPKESAALRKIFDEEQWWNKKHVGSWEGAFQSNTYARLGDGNAALTVLNAHFHQFVNANLTAPFHGEWQIDGNLGQTAAIGEMLMQSHNGEVELLPALPVAWKSGSVSGLRARGGFVVGMTWSEGSLTHATIRSTLGGNLHLRRGDHIYDMPTQPGQTLEFNSDLQPRQ